MTEPLDFDALAETLAGSTELAAEFHGALCGALCVHAAKDVDLLRLVETAEGGPLAAALRPSLERLCTETLEALADDSMRFAPLLPDDDTALVPRTHALAAWCQGFLFGLSSKGGLDLARCTEDLREVVRDFTELTRAAVGDESDLNIEETAYAELVEYVRVGAQLVFMELHPRPTLDPSDSQRLH